MDELSNLESMIEMSCASDDRTESFDLVIQSPQQTRVTAEFSLISNTVIEPSRNLREMYPMAVKYNLAPFTINSYPVQVKAAIRRIHRRTGNSLKMILEGIDELEFYFQKCLWRTPKIRAHKSRILGTRDLNELYQLVRSSCDDEWLVDTLNVHVENKQEKDMVGRIKFVITKDNGTDNDYIGKSIELKKARLSPVTQAVQKDIKKEVDKTPQLSTDSLFILIFITGFLVIVFLYLKSLHYHHRHKYYSVSDQAKNFQPPIMVYNP